MSGSIDNLPKWAREELVRLRRTNAELRLDNLQGLVGRDYPGENMHLQLYPEGSHQPSAFRGGRFTLGGGHWDYIDFRREGPNQIYVNSGMFTLRVLPRAGNAILLETK